MEIDLHEDYLVGNFVIDSNIAKYEPSVIFSFLLIGNELLSLFILEVQQMIIQFAHHFEKVEFAILLNCVAMIFNN
jgi:hypothetical protein